MATQINNQQGFSSIREELEFIRKRLHQLQTDLNAIVTTTGLATDGSAVGATAQEQEFTVGVYSPGRVLGIQQLETGLSSTTDGQVIIANSAGTDNIKLVTSGDAALTIDNYNAGGVAKNDIEIGVGVASTPGVSLNVAGNLRAGTSVSVGSGTVIITEQSADEMLLTANSGVFTSSGLTVTEELTVNGAGINWIGTGTTFIKVNGPDNDNRLELNSVNPLIIDGSSAYTGTIDLTTAVSITVVNGIITAVG